MKKWLEEKIFSDSKKTLLFIGLITFFILFTYQIVLLCYGTYFNSNSDDVAQYSPILIQYINYFKQGHFSWYNFSNNSGASIFADTYYVPIDIFTLLILVLSFVIDGTIAFSIVNLSKILFGVIVFAYFLQRKGFKNWLVALLSLMYFSFGGCWTFAVYPTYFSLFFYLPLSLLVIDYYVKGKKWLLPLYSFVLVLYNFYTAYTLFIFMVFVFLVVKIRDNYSSFKNLVKDVLVFGIHLVLGVMMGLVVFLPSMLYILNYSVRNTSDFHVLFDLDVYFRMLYKLFVYESGTTTFIMGNYMQHNFNYYIGAFGLLILGIMFVMKDRDSKVYKYSLLVVASLMCIPLCSMIFSGTGVAYTRWFNFINIVLIFMIGHVITNCDFSSLKRKNILALISIVIGCYVFVFIFNLILNFVYSNKDYVNNMRMISQILILFLYSIPIILYSVFFVIKKKELFYGVFTLECIIAIIINFSISFKGKKLQNIEMYEEINNVLDNLDIGKDSLERVYIHDKILINNARYTDVLINDKSFHSFLTKYMYDYKKLYGDESEVLYTYYLNRFSPYSSRTTNYKYIIVNKEKIDYDMGYLEFLYEEGNYKVYKNNDYDPFYVYETYYNEEDILKLEENRDFLGLEKNLFKGVVLEEGKYNLENIEYSYDSNMIKSVDLINDVVSTKISDNIYEINLDKYLQFDYEGIIYFKSENADEIEEIKVILNNGEEMKCGRSTKLFSCYYGTDIDKIIVSGEADDLEYLVSVTVDDKDYAMFFVDNKGENKYLNYYIENSDDEILLKNGVDNQRVCLNGLCRVDDFEFNHVLISSISKMFLEINNWNFEYYYDDLEYYILNKNDKLASNKELTYNKSTIQVKYTRDSVSENDQVVVLPVTYSEEWVMEQNNSNYELVRANGGFLGVLVKNGVKDINVNITFKPSGFKVGLIGSLLGFVIYGGYCTITYFKRKKEKNEVI